ncbi:Alpha/Beta hydrolase protein [Mycena vulgaris]|nr:Alpha/Beta hydrolase protein [Mycena vulgaris]
MVSQYFLQSTAVCVAILFAAVEATTTSPIINLGYARYQGAVDTSSHVTTFLGIRYAAAPINDLRFRAPQRPPQVTGVQQATTQPNQCFQSPIGNSSINPARTRALDVGSAEDCLFLSVSFPSDATGVPTGLLPTIVWIHGGGMYRGADLIHQSNRGVVAVVFNTGFLSGNAVKKNGALNAGLLDQDFALRWVREHISKFGGDPSKVTIWGESSGAGSIVQHVVANSGNTQPPLFRAAIASSISLSSQYAYNDRIPEFYYSEVVAQTNCTAAADSLSCLRAADIGALLSANQNIGTSALFGSTVFLPVVDGKFIRQRPSLSLAQGEVNGNALLAVNNAFEGASLVDSASTNATHYALELFLNLSPAQADQVGALYAGLGTPLFQSSAILAESIFICPTYYMLRAFPGRAFKGEFAVPPAIHAMDVLVYFPSIAIDLPELAASFPPIFNNTAFTNAFSQSFTSFAISLDPNVKVDSTTITPAWKKWDVEHTEILFNKTAADQPVVTPVRTSDALLDRCAFWNSVTDLTAQ